MSFQWHLWVPPTGPSCAPFTCLGCQSSRAPRVKDIWEIEPQENQDSPTPTSPVRPESNLEFTCLPSSPPTEQRCLREHLELVVLHPPHHHRLLFYAEPRAGCAVRVSLCCSPIPLSWSSSSQEGAIRALFSFCPGREILPLLWVSQTVISKPCIVCGLCRAGEPSKGTRGGAEIQPRLDSPHGVPGIELPLPRERGASSNADLSFRRFAQMFQTYNTRKFYRILLSIIYQKDKQ